jgi:hypothetical protein
MNMKKNSILNILFASAVVLLATACEKEYLNTKPESSESPATIFESTTNAKMAINGLAKMMTTQYLGTQGMNGEGTIINWYNNYMGNDSQKCNLTGWTNTINSNWHESPTSNYDIYPWYYYYKLVGNANQVITNIENAEGSENERQFIKAQALVYRAYSYLQLVQFYCRRWSDGVVPNDGIPLRLDISTGDLAKSSVPKVFAQIYADLDEALSLFASSGMDRGANENYLPGVDVAHAVYARAAITREDWSTAASHAAKARANYPFMSKDDYMDSGFNEKNSEWIWSVYEAEDQTLYYYSFFAYIGANSSASICRTYPFAISKELIDLIPETDARRGMYLVPLESEIAGINKTSGAAASSTALYKRAKADYANKLYSTSTIFQYMQFKFLASFMPGGGCFPLFRAGEMAFIEAEAACHTSNDATAQKILNDINKTYDPEYDCTKTGADLLAEVKLYRRFHLWGEGQNWFDFKRWGDTMVRTSIANGGSWHANFAITVKPDEKNHWTWCIPNRESDYNKLINQMAE